MREPHPDLSSIPNLEVFTDVAIDDPAELANIPKRPHPWPRWIKWALSIAALLAAIAAGALLDHFVR